MGIFSKDIETMDDLFVHMLRDIYYAEKRIVAAGSLRMSVCDLLKTPKGSP